MRNRTRRPKRVLALLLCVLMCVSLAPMSAFATDGTEPEIMPVVTVGEPTVTEATEPPTEAEPTPETDAKSEESPAIVFTVEKLSVNANAAENDLSLIPDFYEPVLGEGETETALFSFTGSDEAVRYRVYGSYGETKGFFACGSDGGNVITDAVVTEEADRALLPSAEAPATEPAPIVEETPITEPAAESEPAFTADETAALKSAADALPTAEAVGAMELSSPEYETAKTQSLAIRQSLADKLSAMTDEDKAAFEADESISSARQTLAALLPAFEGKEVPHIQSAIDSLPDPALMQMLFALLTGSGETAATYGAAPADGVDDSMGVDSAEPDAEYVAQLYAALGIPDSDPDDPESDPLGDFLYNMADTLGDVEARTGFLTFGMAEAEAQSYLTEKLGEDAEGSDRLTKYTGIYAMMNGLEGNASLMGTLGGSTETLTGDYMYLSEFNVTGILDGTGPFDTNTDSSAADYSGRPGNDAANNNKIVRSFDSISYDISYRTAASGEYDYVVNGYLYYELRLPRSANELSFDTGNMGWMGDKVDDLSAVAAGANGYTLTATAGSTVIYGKRFLQPSGGNPYAMPGSGTLNVIVNVGTMANGELVQPTFKAWLEGNDTTNTTCPTHNRDEVKIVKPDPVTVTAQLRMNVQLKRAYNTQASQIWDFTSGNANALDQSAGSVKGRLTVYGVTLQLYNDNTGRGLKGCEIPSGDITFDIDLSSTFKPTGGTEVDASANYAPLVWSYDANIGGSSSTVDGRAQDMSGYAYACLAAPRNSGGPAVNTAAGTSFCYNGGAWAAAKSGSKVSFTVSGYTVNPNSFPNTDVGQANSRSTYYNPAAGVQSIGCFSAGELWVVQPFKNSATGVNVLDDTVMNPSGATGGDFYLTVKDSNLRASAASGNMLTQVTDTSNQSVNGGDDSLRSQVYLKKPGTFDGSVYWTTDESWVQEVDANGIAWNGEGTCFYSGLDQATLGKRIGINWQADNRTNGDSSNRMIAANQLVKFDADAITLGSIKTPGYSTALYYDFTYLYAAKPSGGNWASDAEMNETGIDDLLYYSSLAALEADGKVCVAILTQLRPKNNDINSIDINSAMQLPIMGINVTVKNESSLLGNVFQTVYCAEVWRVDDYTAAIANGGSIPTMLGNDPANPTTRPTATISDFRCPSTYVKSVYSGGVYQSGHTGARNIGDSLYIIPYKAAITKSVEQKKENGTDKMENYDLDKAQRYVDYVMYPTVKTAAGNTTGSPTTVTIVDTLPAGLTYQAGTAFIGGTYTQAAKLGQHGSVTGGTSCEPVIDTNAKGKITLTWTFRDVEIDQWNEPLRYCCQIGKTAVHNAEFPNSVYITATDDKRPAYASYGNYATEQIKVTKLSQTSLSKQPLSVSNNPGDDAGWTLNCGNNSANDIVNTVILEALPYNNDSYGSLFDADLVVKSFTLKNLTGEGHLTNLGDWAVWYTTDAAARNTSGADYDYDEITGATHTSGGVTWTQGAIDTTTGAITVPNGQVLTGIVFTGTLKGGETFSAEIKCNAKDTANPLKRGDILGNTLWRDDEGPETSKLYYVSRSLEGVTWIDANRNGKQDSGEAKLSGVTATLYRFNNPAITNPTAEQLEDFANYTVMQDGNGNDCVVETGKQLDVVSGAQTPYSDGRYMFDNMPNGWFAVQFTDSTTVKLSTYTASEANKTGVDDAEDSDGVATYNDTTHKLVSTLIKGIEMYSLEKMNNLSMAEQQSPNHDSGFFDTIPFVFYKIAGSDKTKPLAGAEFTVYKANHTHDATCGGLDAAGTCSFIAGQTADSTVSATVWDLTNPVCVATSGADGKVELTGLGYGVFMLVETKAPEGYQLSRGCWLLDVKPATTNPVTITASPASASALPGQPNAFFVDGGVSYLPNYPKTIMPTSGGKGTTAFMFGGTMLIGTALILSVLPRKRRYRAAHSKT